jgi:hypothetical protein
MSYIRKFFHSLAKQEVRVLGRWNLEKCNIKIYNKVDWANEDHCGVCNEFANQNTKNDIIEYDEEYIKYMM